MTPAKDKAKRSTRTPQDSTPQRPSTLLQRVSSSLTSVLPRISSRRGSSSTNRNDRPGTAPAHDHISALDNMRNRTCLNYTQRAYVPHVETPNLSHSEGNCPYDPNTYFSFPSIEEKGCDLCGVRPFSRAKPKNSTSYRACSRCRTRSPFSHIASTFKRSRGQDRSSTAVDSSFAQLIESSNSSEERPRPVCTAVVAKRIGNPPRKASLPSDLKPSYKTARPSSAQPPSSSTHQSITHRALSRKAHTSDSHSSTHCPRPISPKLHHWYGLPGAKNHPYMHKHELEAHLEALRAGSPSPLRRSIDEITTPTAPTGPYQDFSHTVFYGTTIASAARVSRRTPSPAHPVMRRVETSGIIIIEERRPASYAAELDRSEVYRRRSPQAPTYQDDESTQTRSTVGGKRLELKGGNDRPRLRGGSAERVFRLKKWLPTCSMSWYNDTARTPALERRRSGIPRPAPIVAYQSSRTHQVLPPPFPYYKAVSSGMPDLRGGAGSAVRLPPTLYWLAGGKDTPVTIGSWQKQRGGKRMGGMLGMAMYGARAGTGYDGVGGRVGSSSEAGVTSESRSIVEVGGGGSVRFVGIDVAEDVTQDLNDAPRETPAVVSAGTMEENVESAGPGNVAQDVRDGSVEEA